MSTDLEETEVVETEMIVLASDKNAANDALISTLGTEYLALKAKGPEDQAAFEACDTGRKRLVKFRTGLQKQVKELVAPLKNEIKRIEAQADRYQAKLTVIEEHLKAEVQAVKDEVARREKVAAEELWQLRKRRWLEAKGEPPDSDIVVPEGYLRGIEEAVFESEIQAVTRETFLRREELIRKAEAEAAEAKRRAEEAERLRAENERLQLERQRMEQERRQMAAEREKMESERREAQAKIDAETQRLAQEQRARELREDAARREAAALIREPVNMPVAPPSQPVEIYRGFDDFIGNGTHADWNGHTLTLENEDTGSIVLFGESLIAMKEFIAKIEAE